MAANIKVIAQPFAVEIIMQGVAYRGLFTFRKI